LRNKETLFNANIDSTKLQKLQDEWSILDRDVYNSVEYLESVRTIEIGSLNTVIEE
jgi:hypothetical protein